MSNQRQFCTFLLDGLFFGVEVHKVQEVIRYQEMTRVPLASQVIQGLINLRGQMGAVPLVRAKGGVSGWADGRKGREFPDCYW